MRPTCIPSSIVWEITARCDLKCSHCYNYWTAPGMSAPRELGLADLQRVIANIAICRPRLKVLTISGGEPLLRDDLIRAAEAVKKSLPAAQLNLSTNGQGLTLERARALGNAGVSTVQLTVLSAKPEIHDDMVGKTGAFERTLEAVANAKSAHLLVAVFFVATRRNISDFPGAAKLAIALGADAVVFNRFQPGGRGLKNWKTLTPTPEQLALAVAQTAELRAAASVTFGTIVPPCEVNGKLLSEFKVGSCPIGTTAAYPAIGPEGNLRPCNHSPNCAGSLLESAIEELLQRPCMATPGVPRVPPECVDCDFAESCGGGCLAARELAGEPIYACRSRAPSPPAS